MSSLWTETYRPRNLKDYVWNDPEQRSKVEEWVAARALPHLIFSGPPGVGKTTMALMLFHQMDIPKGDILEINASRERKVEEIQSRWQGFVNTWALNDTGLKYILFDEADSMSALAQRMLRGDMETYSDVCRVVFTCNYPNRIIPALHDRCQKLEFAAMDRGDFAVRMGEILTKERIDFDINVVTAYMDKTYPSLRKCINLLQQNSRNGVLASPNTEVDDNKDYVIDMIKLFRIGKYLEARKLIIAQARPEDYSDIYRFLYTHLELFGKTQDQQDDALLIIRKAVVHHNMVCDTEINLAACLCEIARNAQK